MNKIVLVVCFTLIAVLALASLSFADITGSSLRFVTGDTVRNVRLVVNPFHPMEDAGEIQEKGEVVGTWVLRNNILKLYSPEVDVIFVGILSTDGESIMQEVFTRKH